MPIVFWFSRLQPGVRAPDYEKWVREVDYQAAKEIDTLIHYRVHRLEGPCLGDDVLPYDYIEIAEVTDLEDYRADLKNHPAALRVHAQISQYVASIGNIWTNLVEDAG